MKKLSASLVLYRTPAKLFEAVIRDYLKATNDSPLYIVDNSPEPLKSDHFEYPLVHYIFNNANVGFGAGHNVAIKRACGSSDVHLLLNPDVHFSRDSIETVLAAFEADDALMVAMPKIVYPDGSLQRLCKLLPTPVDLLVRRFVPSRKVRELIDRRYELHALRQDVASDVPTLSGCFLFLRSQQLLQIGGFDERYFMYMEDVDLVRRLNDFGRVAYLPSAEVVHEYAKGSYRNKRLLTYHLQSAIRYFNKWGWIFDKTRRARNLKALRSVGANSAEK